MINEMLKMRPTFLLILYFKTEGSHQNENKHWLYLVEKVAEICAILEKIENEKTNGACSGATRI